MDRSICRISLAAALLALAGAASAQVATVNQAQHTPAATGQQAEQTDQDKDTIADRFCVRETGSRIPAARRADSKGDGKGCLPANGRSYSRDDLRDTGRVDLADALRALDPSIH